MRRALALSVLLLAGCGSLNPFGSRSGMPNAPSPEGATQLQNVWSASVGSTSVYALKPAAVEAQVFVASADGRLSAFEQGREIWQAKTGAKISAGVGSGAGRLVVGTEKGEVIAFTLDGKEAWRTRVSSEVLASPALNDNLVLVRTTDNRIHALDIKDGKRRWVYQRSSPALVLRNAGSVLFGEGVAFAGFPGGKLVALSLNNGAVLWESTIALPRGATELERVADVAGEPVAVQRLVCAAAYQGRVGCVDRQSGGVVWSRDMSSASGVSSDGRALYLSDEKGNVFAMDGATGATLWKQEQLAGRSPGVPVAGSGGVVVVDVEGYAYLLGTNDGSFKGIDRASSTAATAPVVANNLWLVQDTSGRLRALSVK